MTMMAIEALWRHLASTTKGGAQTRIDPTHPLDIYADLTPPERVGLVVICGGKPPEVQPLRALSVEHGRRADRRWTLRLTLLEKQLLPVFAALCQDIVACTRSGVGEAELGQVVVRRIIHWRSLLDRDAAGLGEATLRGLIGELIILRDRLVPSLGPAPAVAAWRGPFGEPQDFHLPNSQRIEVKTIGAHAHKARINGLDQLDSCGDPLTLTIVRMEAASADTQNTISAPALIADLRELLAGAPEALVKFEMALRGVGWHEHVSHDMFRVRILAIEDSEVGPDFPRLIRASVPSGVVDVDYEIELPRRGIP